MNEERLEKLLARYADEMSSVPMPQEIKDRLPKKVSGRVKSIQIMSNLMATGIMIASAAILIVGLIYILKPKQEPATPIRNVLVSQRDNSVDPSFPRKRESEVADPRFRGDDKRIKMSAQPAQTNFEDLSDEEFVSLLMDMHEEGSLPDVESKLFGLDLEVMDFVEMAG